MAALRWLAIGIALVGFGIDQATKHLAVARLLPGDSIHVLGPFVQFTLVRNPGAAFSLGTSFTRGLSIFAILALVGVVGFALPRVSRVPHAVAVGLLLGGIAGNLYDRIFREPSPLMGHVIDFIQVPYFAIFNVADICVVSAAALIIVMSWRSPK
ncbi:MAG: signal peptidase II [Arachnia sp.]